MPRIPVAVVAAVCLATLDMVASGARGAPGERAERLRRLTEKTRLLEERIRALEDKVQACRGDDSEPDDSLTSRVSRLETLLASVSLVQGGQTVRFSGVNVQIVSGLGTTKRGSERPRQSDRRLQRVEGRVRWRVLH